MNILPINSNVAFMASKKPNRNNRVPEDDFRVKEIGIEDIRKYAASGSLSDYANCSKEEILDKIAETERAISMLESCFSSQLDFAVYNVRQTRRVADESMGVADSDSKKAEISGVLDSKLQELDDNWQFMEQEIRKNLLMQKRILSLLKKML